MWGRVGGRAKARSRAEEDCDDNAAERAKHMSQSVVVCEGERETEGGKEPLGQMAGPDVKTRIVFFPPSELHIVHGEITS